MSVAINDIKKSVKVNMKHAIDESFRLGNLDAIFNMLENGVSKISDDSSDLTL